MWRHSVRVLSQVEIFISNLPAGFKPEDLNAVVPKESQFTVSKSFCFVKIPEEADAEEILKRLLNVKLGQNVLRARIHRKAKAEERPQKKKEDAKESSGSELGVMTFPKVGIYKMLFNFVEDYCFRKDFMYKSDLEHKKETPYAKAHRRR